MSFIRPADERSVSISITIYIDAVIDLYMPGFILGKLERMLFWYFFFPFLKISPTNHILFPSGESILENILVG